MGPSLGGEKGIVPTVEPSWGESLLQRFLAAIMALGAVFLGMGLLAELCNLGVAGTPKPFTWEAAIIIGGLASICGFLAILLWSNRSFPRWFLGLFIYGLPFGLLIGYVANRDLKNSLFMAGLLALNYWNTRSFMFPPKKDSMPEL